MTDSMAELLVAAQHAGSDIAGPGASPPPGAMSSAAAAGVLAFRWHTSIEDVADTWSACFPPEQVLASRDLQRAVEAAGLEEVAYHYLVGSDGRGLDCLLPCFTFRVSLVSVAPPWLQAAVAGIRRLWPTFLMVRLFVVGTP